jgi:hypothetical protein
MDLIEGTRRESPPPGVRAIAVAVALGMACLAIIAGTGLGTMKAMAQTNDQKQVALWLYPSGSVFPHPSYPDNIVCVSAVGHPERPVEVHCAPIVIDRGNDI